MHCQRLQDFKSLINETTEGPVQNLRGRVVNLSGQQEIHHFKNNASDRFDQQL